SFFADLLGRQLRDRPDLTAPLQGSCRIVLEGQGGGQWTLDFTGTPPAIDTRAQAADCSITLGLADFRDIVAGAVNPMVSLWDGRVSIEGDQALAGQVAQLIFRVSQDTVA